MVPRSTNEAIHLPLEECNGGIAAPLNLLYPPGVGLLVPAECYREECKPVHIHFRILERQLWAFS